MSYGIFRSCSIFGQFLLKEQFPFTFDNVALFIEDELVASGKGVVNDEYSNLIFKAEKGNVLLVIFSESDIKKDGNMKIIMTTADSVPKYFKIVVSDINLNINGKKENCILTFDKCSVDSRFSIAVGEESKDIECEIIPHMNDKKEMAVLYIKE